MTLKWDDLENFVLYLREQGYVESIPEKKLDFFIAKKFGVSKYTRKNIKEALGKFDFLKPSNDLGIWKFPKFKNVERAEYITDELTGD